MEKFETVYKQNKNSIMWNILKKVQDKELAEDICQNTFIKAYENYSKYDSNKANIKTWLINISNNAVVDYTRERYTRNVKVSLNSIITTDEPEEFINLIADGTKDDALSVLETKEKVNSVVSYIKSLPVLKRRIALYRFIYQKKMREISKELDTPIGTVKAYVSESSLKLRELV